METTTETRPSVSTRDGRTPKNYNSTNSDFIFHTNRKNIGAILTDEMRIDEKVLLIIPYKPKTGKSQKY